MAYTFDSIFAADPNNTANVAANASITIFDPADATKAPITITDPTDSPIANPITVNKNGFGPAFKHATLDRVGWSGGGFEGFFTSYEGMKNEAVAARAAAETAEADAAAAVGAVVTTAAVDASGNLILTKADTTTVNAGAVKGAKGDKGDKGDKGLDGSNVLPTDTAIKQAIEDPASQTKAALSATIATATVGKIDSKDYDAMRPFRAAVGDRSNSGCRIYVRGSSTAEGAMATSYDRTWQRILTNTLRERYPARPGVTHDTGAGFWPPYYQMQPYPANVGTSSGTLSTFATSGLSGKGQWITVGATRTFTFTGTHFDIWYNKLNEATTMTYQVDGGTVVDVPIQNATVAVSTVQVGPLSAGEHTVVIGNKTGSVGAVPFLGFMSYNGSRTAGFHLWEGGFSGRVTGQWTDNSSVNFERWTDAVALIQPNLVIDLPFLNDVVLTGGSAAAAKTAQQAIIDKINAKNTVDPTYLIVLGWLRKDVPEQNDPWTLYKTKAHELAAENPNVTVLDVGDAVGTPLDKSLSIWQDDIHLNDKGMGLLADLIADYLTAR